MERKPFGSYEESTTSGEWVRALVRYIAEEHAALFSQCRPIVINFSPDCDPFAEKKLREQQRLEAERTREWQARAKQEQAQREQERSGS